MRNLSILVVTTVCLATMLTAPAALCQIVTGFTFKARVIGIDDSDGLLTSQVGNDDYFTGYFQVDPDLEPCELNSSTATFNLNGGGGKLVVNIGGLQFESVSTAFPETDKEALNMNQRTFEREGGNPEIRCYREIELNCRSLRVDGIEEYAPQSLMWLRLYTRDCEVILNKEKPLDVNTHESWIGDVAYLDVRAYDTTLEKFYRFMGGIDEITPTTRPFGTIRGSVYGDNNDNCVQDNDEQPLAGVLIGTNQGFFGHSYRNGEYIINAPLGDYLIAVEDNPLWRSDCPELNETVTLSEAEPGAQVDVARTPTQLVEILETSLVSSLARPGFELTYRFSVRNVGTLPYSGRLLFTHDPILLDFSAEPEVSGYSAPLAAWNIDNMPTGEVRHFNVTLRVPPDEKLLGTFICARVETDSDYKSNDDLLRRTSDELCQEIRGAFDPNDIQVFNGTRNADGPILQDQTVLAYLIRFQNEGNEDAITVRVVDELSEFHNIAKLRIGAASHDYEFKFTDSGELEWTFKDINLPPKSEDENGSMGYLKFEVQLKDGLPIDTEIPNKAAIYFDFNSPVITNTVVSRITSGATSVDENFGTKNIQIYPNPASEVVTITRPNGSRARLELHTLLGERLLEAESSGASQALDLSGVAAGSYLLRITDGAATTVEPLRVVR